MRNAFKFLISILFHELYSHFKTCWVRAPEGASCGSVRSAVLYIYYLRVKNKSFLVMLFIFSFFNIFPGNTHCTHSAFLAIFIININFSRQHAPHARCVLVMIQPYVVYWCSVILITKGHLLLIVGRTSYSFVWLSLFFNQSYNKYVYSQRYTENNCYCTSCEYLSMHQSYYQ